MRRRGTTATAVVPSETVVERERARGQRGAKNEKSQVAGSSTFCSVRDLLPVPWGTIRLWLVVVRPSAVRPPIPDKPGTEQCQVLAGLGQ